jgi:hypothetical protein
VSVKPLVEVQGVIEQEYVDHAILQTRLMIQHLRSKQQSTHGDAMSQAEAGERVARAASYARWRWRGVRDGEVETL